jgi:hypothetical protein
MEVSVSERVLPQLQRKQTARVKGEKAELVGSACLSGQSGFFG